jgi:hypothetical protein
MVVVQIFQDPAPMMLHTVKEEGRWKVRARPNGSGTFIHYSSGGGMTWVDPTD